MCDQFENPYLSSQLYIHVRVAWHVYHISIALRPEQNSIIPTITCIPTITFIHHPHQRQWHFPTAIQLLPLIYL